MLPPSLLDALALGGGLASLLITSLLALALVRPMGRGDWLTGVWALCFAEIVFLAQVLSEIRLLGRAGFLAGQFVLMAVMTGIWIRSGRPGVFDVWAGTREQVKPFLRTSPFLALLGLGIIGVAVVNLVFPFLYPPLNGDANAYHLPRAYYWLELGTARHFPASDFRLNQFPQNPSFVFAWIMALSGGFAGLHLFQWFSGLIVSCGLGSIARLSGASRSQALFASFFPIMFPGFLLQMGSAQTDVAATAASTALTLFALRCLIPPGRPYRADLILFGVTLGLGVATKLSVLILLPGLSAGMALLLFRKPAQRRYITAGTLVASGIAGLLALGSYNAVLNTVEIGNPFLKHPESLTSEKHSAWKTEQSLNLIRYSYQLLDWPGLASGPESPIVQGSRHVFESTMRMLGADPDSDGVSQTLESSRWLPDEDRSGFGPVGFLLLITAPLFFFYDLWVWLRTRQSAPLVCMVLILISMMWVLGFLSANQTWSAQKIRYFLVFMPLLCAAVLPRFFGNGVPRRVLATLLAGVSLLVAARVTALGPGGIRAGGFRDPRLQDNVREEVISELVKDLPRMFPSGSVFGVVSEYNDVLFQLFRSLPGFHFRPAEEEEISRLLKEGKVDAVIAGQFRNEAGQGVTKPGIPIPRNAIIVKDPAQFYRKHPKQYRLETFESNGAMIAFIPFPVPLSWQEGSQRFRIPTGLAVSAASGDGVSVLLTSQRTVGEEDGITASCNGDAAGVRADGTDIIVTLPARCLAVREGFLDLELSRRSGPALSFKEGAWLVSQESGNPRLTVYMERLWERGTLKVWPDFVPPIHTSGFYPAEANPEGPFVWTKEKCEIVVPVSPSNPPRALRIELLGYRNDASAEVVVNGKRVLEETLPRGFLSRELPLNVNLETEVHIELRANAFQPPGDGRRLGLCLRSLLLIRPESPGLGSQSK